MCPSSLTNLCVSFFFIDTHTNVYINLCCYCYYLIANKIQSGGAISIQPASLVNMMLPTSIFIDDMAPKGSSIAIVADGSSDTFLSCDDNTTIVFCNKGSDATTNLVVSGASKDTTNCLINEQIVMYDGEGTTNHPLCPITIP